MEINAWNVGILYQNALNARIKKYAYNVIQDTIYQVQWPNALKGLVIRKLMHGLMKLIKSVLSAGLL